MAMAVRPPKQRARDRALAPTAMLGARLPVALIARVDSYALRMRLTRTGAFTALLEQALDTAEDAHEPAL